MQEDSDSARSGPKETSRGGRLCWPKSSSLVMDSRITKRPFTDAAGKGAPIVLFLLFLHMLEISHNNECVKLKMQFGCKHGPLASVSLRQ